jgi:hypothetical protein
VVCRGIASEVSQFQRLIQAYKYLQLLLRSRATHVSPFLKRVIEAAPALPNLLNDHPGQGRDEADVGDHMLILSLSLCEAAAGSGSPRGRMGK